MAALIGGKCNSVLQLPLGHFMNCSNCPGYCFFHVSIIKTLSQTSESVIVDHNTHVLLTFLIDTPTIKLFVNLIHLLFLHFDWTCLFEGWRFRVHPDSILRGRLLCEVEDHHVGNRWGLNKTQVFQWSKWRWRELEVWVSFVWLIVIRFFFLFPIFFRIVITLFGNEYVKVKKHNVKCFTTVVSLMRCWTGIYLN